MDVERAKGYKDKLSLISERLWDIDEWISEYDVSKFVSDKKTRLAVYMAFQELTEASFDIVAMVCRDSRIITKDDYTNVDSLYNKKFIDDNTKIALFESNGLRNILIHRYNNLDNSIAFESIQALLSDFAYFAEVINKWLKSQI